MPFLKPWRAAAVASGGALATAGILLASAGAPAAAQTPRALAPAATAAVTDPLTGLVTRPAAPRQRVATRLELTVTPGRILTVTGVLSRRTGQAVRGRWVAVYLRTGDTGDWRRARLLRATPHGQVRYRIVGRPDLQFTLRFAGDRTFGAAASVTLVPSPSARALDPGAARALAAAKAAARRAGLRLTLNSGYRAWATQQRMYDAAVRRYGSARAARRWVLPPAESTHVRGLALDLGGPAAVAWVSARGARWGLCRTYGNEPWHLEYRPDWIAAYGGRCPPTVASPGDPGPLSPRPHVPVQ